MSEKPLLLFSKATTSSKDPNTRRFIPQKINLPSPEEQIKRIGPKFERLENAFENKRALLQKSVTGATPEQALVFEVLGTVNDFVKAVNRTPGLEWLFEKEDDFIPDDEFYEMDEDGRTDNLLDGRLFLLMSDQRAMTELRSLWNIFKNGDDFPRGFAPWKHVFRKLKNLRQWDISDRFFETGVLEDWKYRLDAGQEILKFEIELWYRLSPEKRREAFNHIKSLIEEADGKIISQTIINEISYHGILVETPITVFNDLSENTSVKFIKSDYIMFFRPVGQAMVTHPQDEPSSEESPELGSLTTDQPVVALLDGLPMGNHHYLEGRLIIDDPDDFSSSYKPGEQTHGTSMASLILHGDLDGQGDSLSRPIYVRPILIPDVRDWLNDFRIECVPEDMLTIDLVHRAVKRIFEGDGREGPAASSVKIINLSIGDSSRPFDYSVSPWARLLDWLSYRYKVLFIVSAGNYLDNLVLNMEREKLNTATQEELNDAVIQSIYDNSQHRRLLTPSESINSLTVGALHVDSSTIDVLGSRKDVMHPDCTLSPINRIGLGFRRSIKPEILMPGGRQLYMEDLRDADGLINLRVNNSLKPPGQKVALPGAQGRIDAIGYTCGTSNATALATRSGAKIYEVLNSLQQTDEGKRLINEENISVYIKALLVHSANWGNLLPTIERQLKMSDDRAFKGRVAQRLLGYGAANIERVLRCATERATVLGGGEIGKDEAQLFTLPLPPSLSGKKVWRRLTISLAWFTPINTNNLKYRKAQLWFDPPEEPLQVKRQESDHNAVRRGTIQHEILEGEKATPFVEGDSLQVKINCREDAGGLTERIPYAIAVTIEVAEGLQIPLYDEIRARIRPSVPIDIR